MAALLHDQNASLLQRLKTCDENTYRFQRVINKRKYRFIQQTAEATRCLAQATEVSYFKHAVCLLEK